MAVAIKPIASDDEWRAVKAQLGEDFFKSDEQRLSACQNLRLKYLLDEEIAERCRINSKISMQVFVPSTAAFHLPRITVDKNTIHIKEYRSQ